MSEAVVSPTVIILPGATWRAELEAELIRLGMPEDRAPISAGRVLSRICKHAGYLNCFQYDAEEPPTEEFSDSKQKTAKRMERRRPKLPPPLVEGAVPSAVTEVAP